MKMGIGIGWPNSTSGSNQGQMVYFQIQGFCGGEVREDSTTQLVDNSIYQTGDYVDFDNGDGDVGRVLLGAVSETIGENVFNIGGEVYASCP